MLFIFTALALLLPAARHVLEVLEPLSVDHDGPLIVRHISFVEGRGNIIVEYPGEPGGGCISFVGAHLVRSSLGTGGQQLNRQQVFHRAQHLTCLLKYICCPYAYVLALLPVVSDRLLAQC